MTYLTLSAPAGTETEIKRSRFIARAEPIADAEAAEARLATLRAEHPFATHVCYAYVADESGLVARFSDDGEPKGTAGMPMLDVLRKRGLRRTLVAVVRYFGGVKLGAGGLTRAYAGAAIEVLDRGAVVRMGRAELFRATFDYVTAARLQSDEEIGRAYGDAVEVTFAAFDGEEALAARLGAKLGGTVRLTRIGEVWRATE